MVGSQGAEDMRDSGIVGCTRRFRGNRESCSIQFQDKSFARNPADRYVHIVRKPRIMGSVHDYILDRSQGFEQVSLEDGESFGKRSGYIPGL